MSLLSNINIKYKDFEFRTVDSSLLQGGELSTVELVKWSGDNCYTILYWKKGKDNYSVRFVGSRPFEDIATDDFNTIWKAMDLIQDYLDWSDWDSGN